MSIQSEIERIRQNVVNAYDAVLEKGGSVPERANSGNLAAAIQAIPSGGGSLTIRVTAPAGSVVTAEKDGQTYTAPEQEGVWNIPVPECGTYAVRAVRGREEAEAYADAGPTLVNLSFAPVFGVMWDSSNQSTALTRLTVENDEHGLVNTNITTEPVAQIGSTRQGSSPFDAFMPWSGMEEYNVIANAVSYKKGRDPGFSRTSYDTFVYIPEFYCRVIHDGTKWWWYVSEKKRAGFEKHPGSGRYVARYNSGQSGWTPISRSNKAPYVSASRADMRSRCHNVGTNIWQYDYATWCAVWLLYLVEFADWDSQAKVGMGNVTSGGTFENSGKTDPLTYHTGRIDGTDGQTAVQYRWIENPWGNVHDWVDGIIFEKGLAYISLDNANFSGEITDAYQDSGITLATISTYIINIGYSSVFPWSFLPSETGGTDSTYIPDQLTRGSSVNALVVGGKMGYGLGAGLFRFYASVVDTQAPTDVSSRLIYIPQEVA